jgi:hypothetical protein
MPSAVRISLLLAWFALAIAVVASAMYYRTLAVLPFGNVILHLLGYAILAWLQFGIAKGNAWARMLFALFLGWNLSLAAINLAMGTAQLPMPYWLDRIILGLQFASALLLFLPASNAWFRRIEKAT